MSEKTARGISYLFHPLLVPFYTMLLFLTMESFSPFSFPFHYQLILLGIVLLTTVLFPLFMVYLLRQLKMVSSIYLEHREERIFPLLMTAFFYYLTYYMLKNVQFATLFAYYMLGITLVTIIAMVITFFWKISLHMLGAGSLSGLFLGLSMNFGLHFINLFFGAVLLSGLIGFARLKLNAHKPAEIYSGFLVGVFVLSILVLFL